MFKPNRMALAAIVLCTLLAGASAASAQAADAGTVCVIAYGDANQNGVRDPGEETLLDVNINLMLAANVVIANHVTALREPHCFEALTPQQYMLNISSPLYDPVDAAPMTFTLPAGQRVTYEFGAVARPAEQVVDPSASILVIPLNMSTRIGLGVGAALGVMALLTGLGLVIYGLFLHRRTAILDDSDEDGEWADESAWQEPGAPEGERYAMRTLIRSNFDNEFEEFERR
jgi:hypothetical protein